MCRPFFISLLIALAVRGIAGEGADYERDIKPLLAMKCAVCHGALEQEAGLRLDAGVLIRKGSDDGPVVVPGSAKSSLLVKRVTASDDERMPPEGDGAPLDAKQIALIAAWIDAGAMAPDEEMIPGDPRQHWAYQAPVRPVVPAVNDERWSHPIDAFVARKHRQLRLSPVGVVNAHTRLRRIYLDTIGLPPTPEQIDAFISDGSKGAWAKLVGSLLQSPQYGERWGRHWMDVWRYSDWDGYKNELRGSQRHIWRWRDWIVNSLNNDKGYDRMIVEMLAGDEVAPNDSSVLAATGFLARNYHKSNRNIWLDATVEHTAKAFLGTTLNCARCHDHKYDPIPQTAYYAFRAFFEPHNVRTDRVAGQKDLMQDGLPRAFDADLSTKTYLHVRGNEKNPDKENPVQPGVLAFLGGAIAIESVELPLEAFYPALKETVINEQLAAMRKELAEAEHTLNDAVTAGDDPDRIERLRLTQSVAEARVEEFNARYAADRAKYSGSDAPSAVQLAQTAAAAEQRLNVAQAESAVYQRRTALTAAESSAEDDQKKKQQAIANAKKELSGAETKLKSARNVAAKPRTTYTAIGKTYPRTSSGRRLALAQWIVSKDNPLAARVAVNHIWMRHFGAPLVESVFDFGLRSPRPPYADLLDWLSVELMENQWSLKHIHRLILTSRTWQLASSTERRVEPSSVIDPDNRFLWRANVRRLDAEVIRDSLLAVSDQLDTRLGGPDIDFRQGESSRRRSLYLRHAYEKQMKMLVLFDAASPNECYRRSVSVIPQQALALANSSLSISQSRILARRLWDAVPSDDSANDEWFVRSAFLKVLARPPDEEELMACLEFIEKQMELLSDRSKLTTFSGGKSPQVKPATDPHQRTLENLVHVLMNHNDFVTVR